MTPNEAIKVVEKCIEAEISRGKTRKEAVDRVEEVLRDFAKNGTDPVMGVSILKNIFLGVSPRETANDFVKNFLKS